MNSDWDTTSENKDTGELCEAGDIGRVRNFWCVDSGHRVNGASYLEHTSTKSAPRSCSFRQANNFFLDKCRVKAQACFCIVQRNTT